MLSREALLFSPTRDLVPSSDDAFCAEDLLAAQEALEAEAFERLPFEFNTCTWDEGPLRQPVYSCITCSAAASTSAFTPSRNGICSACSIACHGDHELVELFSRRDFRCDCGTVRMGEDSKCDIRKCKGERLNDGNLYNENFDGSFCICGVPYDPLTETDEMYQCIVCEDWLHHNCLFGVHSASSDSPLTTDSFDILICAKCVTNPKDRRVRNLIERWAGIEGSGVLLVDGSEVIGRREESENGDIGSEVDDDEEGGGRPEREGKRKAEELEELDDHKDLKRVKSLDSSDSSTLSSQIDPPSLNTSQTSSRPSIASTSTTFTTPASSLPGLLPSPILLAKLPKPGCIAPPLPLSSQYILSEFGKEGKRINIYLEEGWRERWCRCGDCLPLFFNFPYFLEEEETYEPPEEVEHKSTEELGLAALEQMPRDQAIEGAFAYQTLSTKLKAYLKPFADAKKVVTKEIIHEFFNAEKEKAIRR